MNSIQFDCIAVFACIRWTGIQALAQTLHVVRFEFMKADAGGKRSCSHGTHAAELRLNHTRVVTDPKGAGADGVEDSQRLCRTAQYMPDDLKQALIRRRALEKVL